MNSILHILRRLAHPWTWLMALRESRAQSRQMLLFLSSIVFGIAAIVSLQSYGVNVATAMNLHAKKLLGADLTVSSRSPFPPEAQQLLDSIPGRSARDWRFATMAFFPRTGGSRLAQVRAMDGDFPFYGELVTSPASAAQAFQAGPPRAIVEETLLIQFKVGIGDTLRIGRMDFDIVGALRKLPGESIMVGQMAPRVLIPLQYVDDTGLVQFGSRVFYRRSFQYPADFDEGRLAARLAGLQQRFGLRFETVESRKNSLGRRLRNLFRFLDLVALTALLLGGIGIGSSIQVFMERKLSNVALLRCLGARGTDTFAVYLLQTLMLGVIGGFLGSILGVTVQFWLPVILSDFIPVAVKVQICWPVLGLGVGGGIAVTLLFSITPLLAILRTPPLAVLRRNVEADVGDARIRSLLIALGGALLIGTATILARKWQQGLGFGVGLVVVFGALAGAARMVIAVIRRSRLHWLPFVIRQGLSNLHRPRNQTAVLFLALGIGTFLIMTMHLVRGQLLHAVRRSESGNNPNMVLFDIQVDQRQAVTDFVAGMGLPILQEVPIVVMRLSKVKNIPVEELRRRNRRLADGERIPSWTLNREYRSTYRNHLIDSETLLAGTFEGSIRGSGEAVPVSIEEDIAADLRVGLGDSLIFDVQGIPISTVITSIRQVDWYKIQPNFFLVFPQGSLDLAPQTVVLVTRVPDTATSASLQREAVERFPNLSLIDLTLVLDTMTDILDNIGFAVRFIAWFSIVTGLIVLIGSIGISHQQRVCENAILKVLGASRRQIAGIMVAEYATLGILAANSGIVLAMAASYALARLIFETQFAVDGRAVCMANLGVIGITLAVGMISSARYYREPPLDVLRRETW